MSMLYHSPLSPSSSHSARELRETMSTVRSYSNKRKADAGATPPLKRNGAQTSSAAAGAPRFLCDLCDSGFDSETEVQIHRPMVHHQTILEGFDKYYGCCVCLKWFPLVRQLRSHVRRKHLHIEEPGGTRIRRPVFVCNECHYIFFNKAMLEIHTAMKHNCGRRLRRVDCPKCGRSFAVRSVLVHLDMVHSLSVESCPVCLECQSSLVALRGHMRRCHPAMSSCSFCGYISSEQRALDAHLIVAHDRGDGEGEASAPLPARYFTEDNTLHAKYKWKPQLVSRGMRLQDMIYICVLCQETVHSDVQMLQHIKREHAHSTPPPRRSFACGECGVSCGTELLLKHHIFKQHELIKLIKEEIEYDDTPASHQEATDHPSPITKDEITNDIESDMCEEPAMIVVVET